jgi:hypothetical protein
MSVEGKKKLTGWLILLMVILGLGALSGIGREITEVRRSYEPHFSQYASLQTAVLVYQCLLFGSACTALYTVRVLYQRVPGTLPFAIAAFTATILVRIAAGWIFDLVAGLPEEFREPLRSDVIRSLMLAAHGVVWYLYLARSKRVREIYAA